MFTIIIELGTMTGNTTIPIIYVVLNLKPTKGISFIVISLSFITNTCIFVRKRKSTKLPMSTKMLQASCDPIQIVITKGYLRRYGVFFVIGKNNRGRGWFFMQIINLGPLTLLVHIFFLHCWMSHYVWVPCMECMVLTLSSIHDSTLFLG